MIRRRVPLWVLLLVVVLGTAFLIVLYLRALMSLPGGGLRRIVGW